MQFCSFVLCYPNNPVGAMLTANQAKEIADTLDELLQDPACGDGFSVILDEVYIGITSPDVEYYSVLHFASPRLVQSCFLIVSASKGLGAMPGARAGCLISKNRALLSEILKIQSATAANASIVSQVVLLQLQYYV
jgi:aspartate/methionine/tyrosine aminotransferase